MLLQSILALSVLFFYIVCRCFKCKVNEKYFKFQESYGSKMMKIDAGLNQRLFDIPEAKLKRKVLSEKNKVISKKNNFNNTLYYCYNIVIFILLLFNTLFIILNLEFVQIYSFIIILLNVLTAIYWIFFWFKFKSSVEE